MNRLQEYVIDRLVQCEEFALGMEGILKGNNVSVGRLPGSALSLFITAVLVRTRRPICLVTTHSDRAEQIYDDLEFLGLPRVFHYAEDESLPYEFEEPGVEILAKQIETYGHLADREETPPDEMPEVILASLESVLSKSFSLDMFRRHTIHVRRNEPIVLEALARDLTESGHIRVPIVETRGEFAIRGGIVDVFPLDGDFPIRLDLFGEQIESIRYFDPSTQRSLKEGPGDNITLPPAKKNLLIQRSLEKGKPLEAFHSLLPEKTLFVLDEPERFPARAKEFGDLIQRQHQERQKSGEKVPAPPRLFESLEELEAAIAARGPRVEHHLLGVEKSAQSGWSNAKFRAGTFEGLKPHFDTFLGIVREQLERDNLVVIACDNEGQMQRFEELLGERHLDCTVIAESDREARAFRPPKPGDSCADIVLTVGPLHTGFLLPEANVLFLTDREVFGRYKRRHMYRKLYRGTPVRSVVEIERGDLVVHVNHGIGQYVGLRRQQVDGKATDLIELVYQNDDRLLVPLAKIELVQKYSAVEGAVPALDKLGSKRWIQRKKKSQEKIEQMAQELLELYARRSTVKGHAYGEDTVWQNEFEASFLYQETPDQVHAIDEVKADMARPLPSDRLICGDVGYGKTEVAMRAAFKVFQEHRQVAVLVPTTILAQQHYATFRERFADYDPQIEMLSRFKTPRQQREILKRVRLGEVDIIVGTHRLLSKDVRFADLGLVVVDEEHRFGVRHKEKLKQMRTAVDVLTLTATPIPRTLHMALAGLRDMSVINTPPADRVPIRTHVIHFESDLIEEAILRELNRGGQVFFVHNRVHNIDQIARRLREIVPQASVAIGHGQMDEKTLERVMLDFVDGKFDILCSTTIIESGLDIPNVNTIVINRADALGLAQLYQLRGRVGRSARQAYAYLIVPHGQAITDQAVRRLAAIQEFVELGSGFQIAMRDMEIRGTGNILGREQHGAMAAIGFELYCDLLQKAVRKLKGEDLEIDVTAELKWAIDAFVPENYIPVESQRLAIYKRLAQVHTLRAIHDIRDEMRDRFGRLPEPADVLVELAALRIAASLCSIRRVTHTPSGVKLETAADGRALLRGLERVCRKMPTVETARMRSGEQIDVTIRAPDERPLSKLREAVAMLRHIAEATD